MLPDVLGVGDAGGDAGGDAASQERHEQQLRRSWDHRLHETAGRADAESPRQREPISPAQWQ
jgi:hypothetical protein